MEKERRRKGKVRVQRCGFVLLSFVQSFSRQKVSKRDGTKKRGDGAIKKWRKGEDGDEKQRW